MFTRNFLNNIKMFGFIQYVTLGCDCYKHARDRMSRVAVGWTQMQTQTTSLRAAAS
uniref:Uncharacterized protein n=1 Tax=Anguilla anguilla TaxID=7936 RepID=A0A0E9W0Y9_ANGAN